MFENELFITFKNDKLVELIKLMNNVDNKEIIININNGLIEIKYLF